VQQPSASEPNVLAIAIAHELGHMLLPNQAHAKRGLMESPWNSGHFRSASAGLLHFSPETAELMKRSVMTVGTVTAAKK